MHVNRRNFLATVLPATAAVALARPVFGKAPTAALTVTPLGPGLHLVTGAGGNVTVFDSPEGVLLVDGGAEAHSAQLLKTVRELTGKPRVHTLFNTHCHRDQVGSNAALGASGTRIVAHENTRLWLGTEIDSKWEGKVYPRLPAKARPTDTFYTTGALNFGGERIEYGYLPQAHTDGDIYVHFRGANVLVASDIVSAGAFPIIDYSTNGWIGGLGSATQALFDMADDATRIVPGLGGAVTREHVKAENTMLVTMRQRLSKLIAQGMSAQEMIDARPAQDLESAWGDPALFIRNAYPGMVHRAGELGVSIV